MKTMKSQGDSILEIITTYTKQYLKLKQCIYTFYHKLMNKKFKTNQSDNLMDKNSDTENFFIQSLQMILNMNKQQKNVNSQVIYYQRSIYQQNYGNLVSQLFKRIQQIVKNEKDQFYSQRSKQVRLFKQIIIVLQIIYNKVEQNLKVYSIIVPKQVKRQHQQTMKILQSIKFQSGKKLQNIKYEIKFHFPEALPKNNDQKYEDNTKKQKVWKRSIRFQRCKQQKITTNATTRPSSGCKSPRQINKLSRKWNYSICPDQNQVEPNKDSHNLNQPQSTKIIKTPTSSSKVVRPLTSKRVNYREQLSINRISENTVNKSLNSLQDQHSNFKDNYRSQNNFKTIKNQQINSHAVLAPKSSRIIKNRETSKESSQFYYSILQNKKLFQNNKKSQRKVRNGLKNNVDTKIMFSRMRQLQLANQRKSYKKKKRLSQNLNQKQRQILKTKFYNSYQLRDITQHLNKKLFDHNSSNYKRKYFKSAKKHIKITQSENENEDQQHIQNSRKNQILLIKAPKQKFSTIKRQKALKKSSFREGQKLQYNTPQKQPKKCKAKKQHSQLSNSFQHTKLSQVDQNKLLNIKVSQQDIKKIRSDFVQARWENNLISANDKQSSVFFIQQGFLGHKENIRFQRYLKQAKQAYGAEFHRQPFNLQTQVLQLNNEKVRQLERFYTFKIQEQWIKQNILVAQNNLNFSQKQIQSEYKRKEEY